MVFLTKGFLFVSSVKLSACLRIPTSNKACQNFGVQQTCAKLLQNVPTAHSINHTCKVRAPSSETGAQKNELVVVVVICLPQVKTHNKLVKVCQGSAKPFHDIVSGCVVELTIVLLEAH